MATLGEYLGAGASTTKLLLHLNGNSNDSSGNGNNGTDSNITYSQANGKFGQGAGFVRTSSSYISIPNSTSLNITGNLTVSLWAKFTSLGPSDSYNYLFSKSKSGTDTEGYALRLTETGSLQFLTYQYGTLKGTGVSTNTLSTNTLYNIICTTNGTTWIIYVNGSVFVSASSSGYPISTDGPLFIGRRDDGKYNDGSIDEVIIENRAWSAEEVKKYYTNAKGFYATL